MRHECPHKYTLIQQTNKTYLFIISYRHFFYTHNNFSKCDDGTNSLVVKPHILEPLVALEVCPLHPGDDTHKATR